MPTIPMSSLVQVDIAVGAQFPQRAGFGTLNLVTNETGVVGPAERIRAYSNIEGVEADWPASSEVVAAASSYFSQNPRPTSLKVSVRFDTDQAAQLRGGSVTAQANLSPLTDIVDGEFAISIDGAANDIVGIDLSAATTMEDVAATIQTAVRAVAAGGFADATVTYDGQRFLVSSGTQGAASTISYATSVDGGAGADLSDLLDLVQGRATKTDGIDAESIRDSLAAINARDDDWYGLAFTKEVRDGFEIKGENAVEEAAAWIEARKKVFFNQSNDLDTFDSVTDTDIGSVLQSRGFRRTLPTVGSPTDEYPGVSIAGRAFTVDFSQANSTITLMFKQGPGVTAERLSVSEKMAMDSKNVNAFILVGENPMYAEGRMANGSFFDEVHGLDWLENAIQTNLFGYTYTRTTKVPYTDKGTAALQQQLIRALDEAVANGLVAPGETIDGEFLPRGYTTAVTPVANVNQSDKEDRQYGGLSFKVLGAGAIHGIQVNGTFER